MNAPHIRVGQVGEETVANHLARKGYAIIGRNYRKKWGEIDIIAKKDDSIHFVEVKTVSYGTQSSDVSHGTYMPEENVSRRKLQRIFRTIETWLLENRYTGAWQVDVASVWIDEKHRKGRIKLIENVIQDF